MTSIILDSDHLIICTSSGERSCENFFVIKLSFLYLNQSAVNKVRLFLHFN